MIFSATALVLGGIAFSAKPADAYRGDPSVQGPNCSEENHEAMEAAFDTNDYHAWASLKQGKGRVALVINENNFARFAQAHKLAQEGKMDEAKQIRAELGLGLKDGQGQGYAQGYRGGT